MAGIADPGDAMDVQTDVRRSLDGRLAGVQAHAHANLVAFRPCVRRERPLRLDGPAHGVPGVDEDEEHLVAAAVDLHAAGGDHCIPDELTMLLEHVDVASSRRPTMPVDPSMSVQSSVTVPVGSLRAMTA